MAVSKKGYYQLQGPFNKNENIVNILDGNNNVTSLGISIPPIFAQQECKLIINQVNDNSATVIIDNSGIYQIENVNIIRAYFLQDMPENTYVNIQLN